MILPEYVLAGRSAKRTGWGLEVLRRTEEGYVARLIVPGYNEWEKNPIWLTPAIYWRVGKLSPTGRIVFLLPDKPPVEDIRLVYMPKNWAWCPVGNHFFVRDTPTDRFTTVKGELVLALKECVNEGKARLEDTLLALTLKTLLEKKSRKLEHLLVEKRLEMAKTVALSIAL